MVQGKATLVLDLGNSSTKGIVLFGKNEKTGQYRERQFEISNVFSAVDVGSEIPSEYTAENTTILNVDATVAEQTLAGWWCTGLMQENEYSATPVRPSAKHKKYKQPVTVLSVSCAFLKATHLLLEMSKATSVDNLDITWDVVALLPPGDLSIGKEMMIDLIRNVTEVDSILPNEHLNINVDNVVILPEGYCAYIATVYDRGQTFRPDYKFLMEQTVLVYDIGAGTTDCLVIKNNHLVQNSMYTVTMGGNNVDQDVKKALKEKELDLDLQSIRHGVVTGYVKDGAKELDIADIINLARENVAKALNAEFINYLDGCDTPVRSIGYMIICGGGSMTYTESGDRTNTNLQSLSYKILQNLHTLSPNMELVNLPKHTVLKALPDDEGYKKVTETISPRELNLIGARIMAETVLGS